MTTDLLILCLIFGWNVLKVIEAQAELDSGNAFEELVKLAVERDPSLSAAAAASVTGGTITLQSLLV